MKQVLLVFLGGGAGSVFRYLISRPLNLVSVLPFGTWTVNVVGSLCIGFLAGLALKQPAFSDNASLFLITGFCGGFTTFSAFALENQSFLKSGDLLNFGLYSLGSIILGVAAVFLGIFLSRLV